MKLFPFRADYPAVLDFEGLRTVIGDSTTGVVGFRIEPTSIYGGVLPYTFETNLIDVLVSFDGASPICTAETWEKLEGPRVRVSTLVEWLARDQWGRVTPFRVCRVTLLDVGNLEGMAPFRSERFIGCGDYLKDLLRDVCGVYELFANVGGLPFFPSEPGKLDRRRALGLL